MDNVLVAKRMNARLKRGVRAHAVVVLLLCALTACSSEPAEDIGTEAEVPAQTDWNIASQNHRCDPSVREKLMNLTQSKYLCKFQPNVLPKRIVMEDGTPSATAGTCATLHAPLAITTVRHCQSPWSVATL